MTTFSRASRASVSFSMTADGRILPGGGSGESAPGVLLFSKGRQSVRKWNGAFLRSLLRAGCVEELRIRLLPFIGGKGTCFPSGGFLPEDVRFRLAGIESGGGAIHLRYVRGAGKRSRRIP
jgi:hypothetical protein